MPRHAPIVTFLNVSGEAVREHNPDGSVKKAFTQDGRLELRPEHERHTERQRERQAELVDELSNDDRFYRLPDRQPSAGEVASESTGEEGQ